MDERTALHGQDPERPFASVGDRLIAQVVDGMVGFGLFFFVGNVLAPRFGGATESGFNLTGAPALLIMAIVGLLLLAYFVVAEAAAGATLGKLAAGIQVQTTDGHRVGAGASVIRNVMRIVDGIGVYLVAALAVMLTKRHQRLGDLAAGTIVVRHESGRLRRAGALIVAILVAIGGVVGGLWLRTRPVLSTTAQAAEPHQTFDQYKPKEGGAVIKAVSLSASDRDVFDPKRVSTEFAEGVWRIVVWYRWEGAKKGHRIDIHWFLGETLVLQQGEAIDSVAGSAAWVLKMSAGGTLPAGNYRVELLENTKRVTAIPFRIGTKTGAAPRSNEPSAAAASGGEQYPALDQYKPKAAGAVIRAVSLSSSTSNKFDSTKVGTEFAEGVARIVVLYEWEGAKKGYRVGIRWSKEGSVILEQGQTLETPEGIGAKVLLMNDEGRLPAGSYRVELLENGKPVTAIPFQIGAKTGAGTAPGGK